nr:Hypothetical protein [Pseudomonas aeruginosa]
MRSVLNRLHECADRLDARGTRAHWGARDVMTQQLDGRVRLFHALRRPSSWHEVFDLNSANAYTLIRNGEDIIAADMSTALMFSLSDCGHRRLVFEQRLGHLPDSPPTRR